MIIQPLTQSVLSSAIVPKFASIIAQGYKDDYYYEDDGREYEREPPRGRVNRNRQGNSVLDFLKNQKQVGASLITFGIVLTLLSMLLLFEKNLLRLGNMSLIVGSVLLIGPREVSAFFLKKSRMQATIITAIGVLLVLGGKPRVGLIVQLFGLLNLFGNMFPFVLALLKSLPGVSPLIKVFEDLLPRGRDRDGDYYPPNQRGRRPPPPPYDYRRNSNKPYPDF